jgi:hypothetical protein
VQVDKPDMNVLASIFQNHRAGPVELKALERESADESFGQYIPSNVALSVWQALLAVRKDLKYYPLLMENDSRFVSSDHEQEYDVAETLELGLGFDAVQWLAERWKEIREDELDDGCRGEMPKMRASKPLTNDGLYLIRSLNKKSKGAIFLALLPVGDPWIVPAYLGHGGWNDCPDATAQVCMQKYWFERYGALPIVEGGDYVELCVERPPQTGKAALELAEEQFAFCQDIVSQGTQTIENLAAELFQSPLWFFWWD